jgi:hypothetical protein
MLPNELLDNGKARRDGIYQANDHVVAMNGETPRHVAPIFSADPTRRGQAGIKECLRK